VTKRGIAYGREPYGDGVLIVIAEVTPRQGTWESHVQGEAAQVTTIFRKVRYSR